MTEDELMTKVCPEFSTPESQYYCIGSKCSQFRVRRQTLRDPEKSEAKGKTVLYEEERAWCGKAGKEGS